MKKLFSTLTRGFYVQELRSEYEAANNWPNDLQEVDDETEQTIRDAITAGSTVSFVGGKLTVTEAPPEPVAKILARALVEVRIQRERILNTLDGIAGRTSRAGDTVTAKAADDAILALLDITKLPALLSATNHLDMKAAVMARYKQIAGTAPAAVKAAFIEALAP